MFFLFKVPVASSSYMFHHVSKKRLVLSVCFCSRGLLLQRLYSVDLAAPRDGHHGLHRDTVFLHGGEDAEHVR